MPTPHPPSPETPPPVRVLICRLSAHGDVAQALPLLHALKSGAPGCRIGWLVESSAAPLLENHPLIDRLHVCHRKQWQQAIFCPWRWPKTLADMVRFVQEIRQEGYDTAIDVQGLLKSALWPWLAGIPRRLGNQKAREGAEWFYTQTLPPHPIRVSHPSAVSKYLEFVQALGLPGSAPVFTVPPVSPDTQARVDALLAESRPGAKRVALAPFTRWASKHWRPEHWHALIGLLLEAGMQPLLVGSPGDVPQVAPMLQGHPPGRVLNLVGKTGWADLYALFQRTDALIGPDSAPLHIANATGHPVIVGLYGPTAPGRTGPLGDRHRTLTADLDCQPCFEHHCPLKTDACMRQLSPAQVMDTLQQALAATAAPQTRSPV